MTQMFAKKNIKTTQKNQNFASQKNNFIHIKEKSTNIKCYYVISII